MRIKINDEKSFIAAKDDVDYVFGQAKPHGDCTHRIRDVMTRPVMIRRLWAIPIDAKLAYIQTHNNHTPYNTVVETDILFLWYVLNAASIALMASK